jgi:hypothetical protein
MNRRLFFIAFAAVMASVVLMGVQASANSSQTLTPAQITQFIAQDAGLFAVSVEATMSTTTTTPPFKEVKPHEFDPGKTILVQAAWSGAQGCPTASKYSPYPDTKGQSTYTDSACSTGDSKDDENDGLVLVKTGPTDNNAAAFAELKGVKSITLTELGYDIRKVGGLLSPNGSHCGAGAPRFNVETTDGFFFVGCRSPIPTSENQGQAWDRLRWGTVLGVPAFDQLGNPTLITGTVKHIFVVFDEGSDQGSDFFGEAILDNIDVNGTLVGHGPDESEP